MVAHCCALLDSKLSRPLGSCGIVVGCGAGDEVVYMRRALGSRRIFGVDVATRFSLRAREESGVVAADALHLPFARATFDFAAAFHSLEHVGGAREALQEIARVLRPGAWLYAGVPNRTRILGYIGSFDASPWQKLAWNLKDWKARLAGKFRNEVGAHAGFDRHELTGLLAERFNQVQIITEEFLRFKYRRRIPESMLDALLAPALIDYSAPSHYAICRTPVEHA
jgi:SAM-dependent methyltransferase